MSKAGSVKTRRIVAKLRAMGLFNVVPSSSYSTEEGYQRYVISEDWGYAAELYAGRVINYNTGLFHIPFNVNVRELTLQDLDGYVNIKFITEVLRGAR